MTAYDRPTIGRFYPTIGMLSPLLSPVRSACDRLRSACVLPPHTPQRVAGPAFGLGASRGRTRKAGQVRQPDETRRAARRKGAGTWCLERPTPPSPCFAAGGPAVAVDSLEASMRCPTACPRSNESAGLLGLMLQPSNVRHMSHLAGSDFATAITDLAHMVQTHRHALGTNAGKTATFGITPRHDKSQDGQAARWPEGVSTMLRPFSSAAAATDGRWGVGALFLAIGHMDDGGRKPRSPRQLLASPRVIPPCYRPEELDFWRKLFRKNRLRRGNRWKLIGARDE
jgi:hypothetical protein